MNQDKKKQDFFRLKENGTTVRVELLGGVTTFFTMAYIIFVNPAILSAAGMDSGAVMLATCISAAVGTLLMGLIANYPIALAPGMGLNAFFAYTICGVYGYSWQAGLAAVFLSGVIFIVLTATGVRTAIVNAIPMSIKKALGAGLGLFIALVGLEGAGIIGNSDATLVTLGDFSQPTVILAIIGLLISISLVVWKVTGGLFIGILATTVVGLVMQFGMGLDVGISMGAQTSVSLAPTFGKFLEGFGELLRVENGIGVALLSLFYVLISLTLVDMFDTMGMLYALMDRAGFVEKDGKMPDGGRAMMADAISTSVGAVLGTSTVTSYAESSAGVAAGARTGLASMATTVCFLLAIIATPVLGFIPGGATYPVLVVVGVYMFGAVRDIEWDDMEVALPAFLTLAIMPFSYSVADGIAFGSISYTVIKLVRGKAKEIHPIMYVIVLLFVLRYALQSMQIV